MKQILVIMMLLLLTACGKEATVSTLSDPSPDQEMNSTEKGVSLLLDQVAFAESPAIINTVVQNNSELDYRYGEFYHIEIELDGFWYIITYSDTVFFNNPRFIDTGSLLLAGHEIRQNFSVEKLGVKLLPGQYRLVKTLLVQGTPFHEVSIAVPFSVE